MKTVKKGFTPEQLAFRKKYWWNDEKMTCKECESVFQLEQSDQPTIGGHYYAGALMIDVYMKCPNCETRMDYKNPPLNNNEVREIAAAYAEAEERENMRAMKAGK